MTQAGLAGLQTAQTLLERTANRIAAPPSDTLDLSAEMVSLLESRNLFETNIRVLQTADDMTKSTIDILA